MLPANSYIFALNKTENTYRPAVLNSF